MTDEQYYARLAEQNRLMCPMTPEESARVYAGTTNLTRKDRVA